MKGGFLMSKSCDCCQEDMSDQSRHELILEDGKAVIVCDSCYQELIMLQKQNGVWVKHVILDGTEYLKS